MVVEGSEVAFKAMPYSMEEIMEGIPSMQGGDGGGFSSFHNHDSSYPPSVSGSQKTVDGSDSHLFMSSLPFDSSTYNPMEIPGQTSGSFGFTSHESFSQRNDMMPPFSGISDSLNLYYAPYRPSGADDEHIYHRNPSPSERSDGSDFLDGGMMMNSYLSGSHQEL